MSRLQPSEIQDDEETCLQELRLLLKEDGLRVMPDDEALLMFLRTKKYDVKKAAKTIRNYFRVRRDMPEYFEDLTPSSIPYQAVFHDHKLIMNAKERDSQGRAVGFLKFGAWNTDICSMSNLMRCLLLAAECGLLEEDAQLHGVVAVVDLQGLQRQPPETVDAVNSLPAKIKGIYVVNTPAVAEYAVSLVQFFLPAKLKSRLHFFGAGFSELCGVIPSELIPKDFSGTQEDFDFHAQEDFFLGKAGHFDSMQHLETLAKEELGETPEVKRKCLEELRQLLEGEQNLRVPQDDAFLLMFLRTQKYRVNDALKRIKNYFRIRKKVPEYFEDLTPSRIPYQTVCHEHKLILSSKKRDPLRRAAGYLRFGAWNSAICSMDELMRHGRVQYAPCPHAVAMVSSPSSHYYRGFTPRKGSVYLGATFPRFATFFLRTSYRTNAAESERTSITTARRNFFLSNARHFEQMNQFGYSST
ncbi:hypothetical protein MTO96_032229 [Rhipicephalus appendiculatus]